MDTDRLQRLLQEHRQAPEEFQVTGYWDSYEKQILDTIYSINLNELRSGKYPILATFGFNDVLHTYHPNMPLWKKSSFKFIHRHVLKNRPILPYGLKTSDIQEMAYRHCELTALLTNAIPIKALEVSDFGHPQDLFEIDNKKYTMPFLDYYMRYCFANKHIGFKGDEIVVELGSGSGYQVEVLKKAYPDLTVLCFDLPAQIFLCETYLAEALGEENITGTETTSHWKDLSGIEKGRVHFFGNWQMPLLEDFAFDVFWNAASFGEMEPDVVKHYLSYVEGRAKWVYLLQARHGKETTGKARVEDPITLEDYKTLLSGYVLEEEHDAWKAYGRLTQSGGYFEGVWLQGREHLEPSPEAQDS